MCHALARAPLARRRSEPGRSDSQPASPVRRAQHGVRTAAVQLRRARAAAFRLNRRRQGGIPQARCARSPMPICLPPASCCCLPGKSACPRKADSGFHPRALAPTQRSSTTQTRAAMKSDSSRSRQHTRFSQIRYSVKGMTHSATPTARTTFWRLYPRDSAQMCLRAKELRSK